jgi:phytoene synthase
MRMRYVNRPDRARDLLACRRLLRDGSRSFLAASHLLPREVARAASALYAFCRLADDGVDRSEVGAETQALAALQGRLDRIYAGAPAPIAADRAFAWVVHRYSLPREWPQALLEGFAWDAQARTYEDLAQLSDYAARVAGAVGAMMARIMGVHDREALARACELGIAMQFTNIARDVGEDARMGRLYLPRAWVREAGIDPEAWLAQPRYSPALASVVDRLLEQASIRYHNGCLGIAALPLSCRPGIRAAALLYADIGRAVRLRRFDSVNGRATVGGPRKLALLGQSLAAGWRPGHDHQQSPAPTAVNFLVEAAGAMAPIPTPDPGALERVLVTFERLERRDRLREAGNLA